MIPILRRQWFLIALGSLLAIGFAFSPRLHPLTSRIDNRYIVAAVLFFMALPMDASSMWRALRYPKAVLLAVVLSYGALPLAAWGLSHLLREDLGHGLMIAAAIPCTLVSASVWTRRAGGNDAVAVLVTMLTNMTCFVVTPWWLVLTTGRDVQLDPWAMMVMLAVAVVLPMAAAQLLRLQPVLGAWASRHKLPIAAVSQTGILTMVLLGAVDIGMRLRQPPPGPPDVAGPVQAQPQDTAAPGWDSWLTMAVVVLTVHGAALSAGHLLGGALGLDRPDRIAVGFSGSQKTFAVGLFIAQQHFGGLSMLPVIVYHVLQLVVDTAVADRLRQSAAAGQSP